MQRGDRRWLALGLADEAVVGVAAELGTFGVMSFGPVVTGTGLSEDEVVWTEKLSEWSGTDRVHSAWLQVHKDSAWNISTASCLIVIDVDSFELQVRISMI